MENTQNTEKKSVWEQVKETAAKARDKVVEAGKKVLQWTKDNPEATVIILGVAASATKAAIREGNKARDSKREEDRRERFIYDHSLGMYWELKRPMTTAERDRFLRLKDEGYRTGDILKVMNLLK